MPGTMYRYADEDPGRAGEPDQRAIVRARVLELMSPRYGLSHLDALRAVVGPDGSQARDWFGEG
jgi:hypothetical protein